jgi:glucokinase
MSSGRPDSPPRLLADIGGTNARFALLDGDDIHDEKILAAADHSDIVAAVEYYLSSVGANTPGTRPKESAIAIAGPITGDLVHLTNHPWQFSTAAVRRQLGFTRLSLFNDFTALALALRHLPAMELETIGSGRPVPNAPIALIGPGTGLGVSGLIPTGDQWIPLQGEGGHVTLSVMTEREIAMLARLRQRFSHVSAERVISGQGLVNLYDALCEVDARVPEPLTPAEVTRRAGDGSCRVCMEAVQMFCNLLATVSGNLVLTLGAVGGLYIGGGIVPRLGRLFSAAHFRDRFDDKGRYADYLAAVPVYLIRSELPAFVGLAHSFTDPGPRWVAE